MPMDNIYHATLRKRISFKHEQEVRALVTYSDEDADLPVSQRSNNKEGISINVDLDCLIESISVAPTAPEWILQLVEKVLDRYQLPVPVRPSGLDRRPVA